MENLSTRITYIYGLYEVGKEDEIRYVGKSDNPKNRILSHRSTSLKNLDNTHKSCWVRSVIKNGGQIDIKIIEVVIYDKWSEREIYWISKYDNLTNISPGGETGISGKLFDIEYVECKKWINKNFPNLKSIKDFRKITKQLPSFVPKSPHTVFKNYGWIDWQHFLGYDFKSSKQKSREYLTYIECKKWINENYPNLEKWNSISKKLPNFIPKRPYIVYKNSGWVDWVDFIGVDLSPKTYISYEIAKNYVRKLKLESSKEWSKYFENNKNSKDFPLIPKQPQFVYVHWEGWTNFLNSSIKSVDINLRKMEYNDLLKYVRENLNHIKTKREWDKFIDNNNYDNIPKNPQVVYKDKWISWNYFLNNNRFEKQKDFHDYETCKKIIKENNIKTNKEWRIWVKTIKGIPKSPETFFKNEWISWNDFLSK